MINAVSVRALLDFASHAKLNGFLGTLRLGRGLAMPNPYRYLSWFQSKLVSLTHRFPMFLR